MAARHVTDAPAASHALIVRKVGDHVQTDVTAGAARVGLRAVLMDVTTGAIAMNAEIAMSVPTVHASAWIVKPTPVRPSR